MARYIELTDTKHSSDRIKSGFLTRESVAEVIDILQYDPNMKSSISTSDIYCVERINLDNIVVIILKFGVEDNIECGVKRSSPEYYRLNKVRDQAKEEVV
ncbi:hypothetical protein [Natroniella sp. ANB-PHB2]|uniref:hypothetical protein n=1 Tax=Natroniella sp. ANB-PHB2 TaxID=3384444 RepID=UPI0038D49693